MRRRLYLDQQGQVTAAHQGVRHGAARIDVYKIQGVISQLMIIQGFAPESDSCRVTEAIHEAA